MKVTSLGILRNETTRKPGVVPKSDRVQNSLRFYVGCFFFILCNVFAYIGKLTVANEIYGIINQINDLFCKYL